MGVEEVYISKLKKTEDPKTMVQANTEEDPEYWKKQSAIARHRREFKQEEKMIESLAEPPAVPESPIAITEKINLGEFNIQEQQIEARKEAAAARLASDERIERLEKDKNEINEKLHATELSHVQATLSQKMDDMSKAIAAGMNQKTFADQIKDIRELAGELGYSNQSAPVGPGEMEMKLAMMKLQQQMANDDRTFKRESRNEDRRFSLDMRKYDAQLAEIQAKIQAEQDRTKLFSQTPKIFGEAVGRAMMANANTESAETSPKGKSYHFSAVKGESGNMPCPECQTPMSIGATARTAICANSDCGIKVSIKREEVAV